MKIKFYIFLLLLFSATLFFSCKKYPEGGNAYWAKSKVTGIWSVENLTVDGIDSTSNIKSNPKFCENTIWFTDINDHDDYSLLIRSYCGKVDVQSSWGLDNNKKVLWMAFEQDTSFIEIYPLILNLYIRLDWDIHRLNDEQMWLNTHYNSKEYNIKLIKKSNQRR